MRSILRSPASAPPLPSGTDAARILLAFFRRQGAEVVARLSAAQESTPSLDHWIDPMVATLLPLFVAYARQGGTRALREIAAQYALARPKWASGVLKRPRGRLPFVLAFDVQSPQVLEAVRNAVFTFCAETLATATRQVDAALAGLRSALAAGLERGEAVRELNRRVVRIFDDPFRAARVAQTEASRAVHQGQVLAARQSGVVSKKRWLASSDACDLCLSLDGKEVGLDEDFAVIGTGPYARIEHAPAHPHCFCTISLVLGDIAEPSDVLEMPKPQPTLTLPFAVRPVGNVPPRLAAGLTPPRAKAGGLVSRLKGSFFGECERDEHGRCKPGSGGGGGDKPAAGGDNAPVDVTGAPGGKLSAEHLDLVKRWVQDSRSMSDGDKKALAAVAAGCRTSRPRLERVFSAAPSWSAGDTLDLTATAFTGVNVSGGKSAGDIGWKSSDKALAVIEKPSRGLDVPYKHVGTSGFSGAAEQETIVAGQYRVKEVRKVPEPGTNPTDGYTVRQYVLEEVGGGLQSRLGKAAVAPRRKGSFFETCDRDDQGHCKPGPGGGDKPAEGGGKKPEGGKPQSYLSDKKPNDDKGGKAGAEAVHAAAEDYQKNGTKAKAFKDWFGDYENDPANASKVVDEDGKPLAVYHGTHGDFDEFKANTENAWSDALGFDTYFFSEGKATASSYANQFEDGKILKVYLDIKNPLVIDANGGEWTDAISEASDNIRTYRTPEEKRFFDIKREYENTYAYELENDPDSIPEEETAKVEAAARELQGHILANKKLYRDAEKKPYLYDGAIVKNVLDMTAAEPDVDDETGSYSLFTTVHVAFKPTQIKSVNNRGTFDPGDKNFNKSMRSPRRKCPRLLPVPDVRRTVPGGCGAAAAQSVCEYFGVGLPSGSQEDYAAALGTTEEAGTSPEALLAFFQSRGLVAEGAAGMTLGQLDDHATAGRLVVCPVQDYGDPESASSEDAGHYVIVLGLVDGYVIVQDSSADNLYEDSGTDAAPGRVMIEGTKFVTVWHDHGADGAAYIHYGIVVAAPRPVPVLRSWLKAGTTTNNKKRKATQP